MLSKLKAFYQLHEGDGRRNSPYYPRMMVKLLLYSYATGIFSSRKIANKLHELGASRWPGRQGCFSWGLWR
jgi:transposase